MLKITGYSDKYSAHPGEEVKFYINAEYNDSYEYLCDNLGFLVVYLHRDNLL